MQKIKRIPKKYLIGLAIILIVLGVWFFFIRTTSTVTSYTYGKVRRGEIAIEVTGTGQISASNEIALTSKVSGKISALPVAVGQEVKTGELISEVYARDAYIDLENARIAYQKLIQPADTVSALQAENAFESAQQSKKASEGDIYSAYDTGFNEVTVTYIDIPTILAGIKDMLDSGGYISESAARSTNDTASLYREQVWDTYYAAKRLYDTNVGRFQVLTRQSATSSIETLFIDTYEMTRATAEALKNAKNTADYINDRSRTNASAYTTVQNDIDTWTSTNNSHVSSLNSAITKIQTAKAAYESAKRSVQEKKEALIDLENGADPLDIRSQQLSLQQKENAYADAFTRAPFDGVLAKLNVKLGDEVSNGTSIGTFITKQKIATISLNEIDAAKIKTGQKVSLSVDAIDGLKIEGTVSEVDLVGTVSQGVVTYNVKITLNTQDERIRSGMSISATIITESRSDVLIIPNTALKNGSVQLKNLTFKKVETGLVNDTLTEVISGLNEGDEVVTKTVLGTKTTTTTAPSILGNMRTGGANRAR